MPRLGGAVNLARFLPRSASARAGVPLLRPGSDVAALPDGGFESRCAEPWLEIGWAGGIPAGRWVRLRYRLGFLSDPVRPLLTVEFADAPPEHILLPGPVLGAGIWTGRLPDGAERVSISPVREAGRFVFRLDEARPLSAVAVVAGAFSRNPGLTLNALQLAARGHRTRARARHFLASIWASTPFHAYERWRRERHGPRLPEPWREALITATSPITILIEAQPSDEAALARTLRSVEQQGPGPWRTRILNASDPTFSVADLFPGGDPAGYVGVLRAGDVLDPDALACCAAALARNPGATILYSDEDRIDAAGFRSEPRLKPDWSPRLQEGAPYLGGLVLVRAQSGLRAEPPDPGGTLLAAAIADPGRDVVHVRRILLHRAPGSQPAEAAPSGRAPFATPAEPRTKPLVSAVIPNRDRPALIRTCLEGLLKGTAYPKLEIVVVDNGSTDPATLDLYRSLADERRVEVIERPGAFNFSKLTNAGVASSRGELVMMLNNDIEVIGPDWLDLMVAETRPADIGAVGAKLLYPGGRIQHSGVAIGLGGEAGHVYRGQQARHDVWMQRLSAPHEVSAVTGACLAVSREKYDAVGGLDEEVFPIAFNDIDFCLKLRERGWRNIVAPSAVLYHHESASRGRDVGPKQAQAEREARAFRDKWLSVIRDDPYFHPGLSSMRFDLSLG